MISLKALVLLSYGVSLSQVIWPKSFDGNVPAWFDVSATFPVGTTVKETHLMLQQLLADRFKLAAHYEMRSVQVYALRPSSHGLKIHRVNSAPGANPILTVDAAGGQWRLRGRRSSPSTPNADGLPLSMLINFINANSMLDRMLIDQTTLEGEYNIVLTVPMVDTPPSDLRSRLLPGQPTAAALQSALASQLGLTVKKDAVSMRMLMVDHIEHVSAPN
jgi:uncharacterized protein (TIGR03435 family)